MAVVIALAVVLWSPVVAFAHGGGIRLEVAGDGAGGLDVVATWQKDNHPVAQSVAMTVVAVGPGGRQVGPTRIRSAAEGVGFYHADLQLAPGRWKVTVSATEPAAAKATVEVTVKEPTTNPVPAAAVSGDPAGKPGSTRPDEGVPQAVPDTGGGARQWIPLAGAVLVALAAIVGVVLVRRRHGAAGR